MITITTRSDLRGGDVGTARFVGAEHASGVSFFWVDAPEGTGPDLHVHPYTETWVVLRGEALVEADGEERRISAGDVVTVTAGTRHQFRGASAENVEMVCIHASPAIIQEFV